MSQGALRKKWEISKKDECSGIYLQIKLNVKLLAQDFKIFFSLPRSSIWISTLSHKLSEQINLKIIVTIVQLFEK